MKPATQQIITLPLRLVSYGSALIIVLLPFHAFLTVWASTLVGHYTLLRLWKEALLLLLIGVVVIDIVRKHQMRGSVGVLRKILLPKLMLCYLLLLALSAVAAATLGGISPKAALYGILLDGRYLVFFGVVWYAARNDNWLYDHWRQLLLIPFAVVILFGLLQFAVLPPDFLRHFGYGPDTIAATQTVDQKADYQRIQSTLRGANPLGAYVVVGLAASAWIVLRGYGRKLAYSLLVAGGAVVLALTFSRSAWLGTIAAFSWLLWQALRSDRAKRLAMLVISVAVVVAAGVGYGLRHNDRFQNTFLHTDENSASSISSNQGHLDATREGVSDVLHAPQGGGTGSAGPASVYSGSPARIAENYYVQIAQEIGIIGLGLWLAIVVVVGRRLQTRSEDPLALALAASLVGISLIGLLSHVWTDDTIAYIWWGLAAVALARPKTAKSTVVLER